MASITEHEEEQITGANGSGLPPVSAFDGVHGERRPTAAAWTPHQHEPVGRHSLVGDAGTAVIKSADDVAATDL
jgi:hypothetical protein